MNYKEHILKNIEKIPSITEFIKFFNLKHPEEDQRCFRYLKSNNLLKYKDKFLYDSYNKHIIIINTFEKNVLSYCILNLRNFGKIDRVITFNTMSDYLGTHYIDLNIDYISNVFNYFNVNQNNKIYIFDDCINYMLLENSIFIKNPLRFSNLYETLNFSFVFANNSYGNDMIEKVSKHNYEYFNWKNFLDSYNIKNRIYDIHTLSTIYDLNEFEFNKFLT